MPVPLTDEEYRLFREWLIETYGLDFGPQKREILRTRLEPRRAELGFGTFEQLYFHLKFHPERETERDRLAPYLTNNESYFFRERGQLDVFRDEVLPQLRERLRRSGRREVRLMSAGCGRGEEPYTLAIIVRECGLFRSPQRARITGVDIDRRALAQAREGRYRTYAFRALDRDVQTQYFRELDHEWEISPELREAVAFQPVNLADSDWPGRFAPQDVIFCRNVLIYFDDESTQRVIDRFYRALAPGGYLFLGHAESLSRYATSFVTERRPGALFYRRPEE